MVGGPGSGKTTVARALAGGLALAHIELDGLWWRRGWSHVESDDLQRQVASYLESSPRWVVDGNYLEEVALIVWPSADLVVWLDIPRLTAYRRAIQRTFGRVATREELWGGNRERIRNLGPASMYRLWRDLPEYSNRIGALLGQPAFADIPHVRLRSPSDTANWLASVL